MGAAARRDAEDTIKCPIHRHFLVLSHGRDRRRSPMRSHAIAVAQLGRARRKRAPDAHADERVTLDSLIFLLCCSKRIGVPCDSRRHFPKSPSITVRRTAWRKEQPRQRRSLQRRRRLRRSRPLSGRRRHARNNTTALRGAKLRRLRGLRRSTGGTSGSRSATLMGPTHYDEEGVGEAEASVPGARRIAGRNFGTAMFGVAPHLQWPLP